MKQNGTDRLGLLTAGHCPGTGTYDRVPNAFFSSAVFSRNDISDRCAIISNLEGLPRMQ